MNDTPAKILIGTSGWTYDDWKGPFYPETLPRSKWLDYYVEQFPTVEINATFYRPFTDQNYQNWSKRVPAGFMYVLKAPRADYPPTVFGGCGWSYPGFLAQSLYYWASTSG